MLGRLEQQFNVEYLRLDAEDHQAELKKIAKFAGAELIGDYENVPVGNQFKDPLSYDLAKQHISPEALEAIKPYRLKYGY